MLRKTLVLAVMGVLAVIPASAQIIGSQFSVPNLSGVYRCVQNCIGGRLGYVSQRGWELSLATGPYEGSRAWIDHPGHIWSLQWNEGALYSPDGMMIQFDHGMVWVLLEPTPMPGLASWR
jgi:hypothetical protein